MNSNTLKKFVTLVTLIAAMLSGNTAAQAQSETAAGRYTCYATSHCNSGGGATVMGTSDVTPGDACRSACRTAMTRCGYDGGYCSYSATRTAVSTMASVNNVGYDNVHVRYRFHVSNYYETSTHYYFTGSALNACSLHLYAFPKASGFKVFSAVPTSCCVGGGYVYQVEATSNPLK